MASCSAARLEAPTERSVAKDLPVHGLGGRQQVTTMLSVPIVKAPLMPLTAVSGGPDGGIIRASIDHDHMGSVAAWQARYSPW